MTESGHGAQVVRVTDTHSYELDDNQLKQILMKDEIKDLPVVVVSVAGAYRGGKSFLLNFFLRYLMSPPSSRLDGSWLENESEPLTGFQWRSGIKRTTSGILLWSEPIVAILPNGNKVAVLLMDTQGTFDNTSTVRDCSTIFALSTLLSSVQIYNLSQNIQEDDLQHLQLFTEYGKLVKDQGSTAFQVLEFLVRDWQFPEDYPYGSYGGELLLETRLMIKPSLSEDMQSLRRHIRSSFERVACFLLPHPGFKVLRANFTGKLSDIDVDFKTYLNDLVKSIFSPEKLMPKTINGEQIKARELYNYFKTYVYLLSGNTLPSPKSIFMATVEAGLLSALKQSRDIYETGMDEDCGSKEPSVPATDLLFIHKKHMSSAIEAFKTKKKMGTQKESDKYLQKLIQEVDQRLHQFAQINLAKTQTAINDAKDAYEEAVYYITHDQPLCVHPLDVEKVHEAGFNAAVASFDAVRKRFTNDPDEERNKFIKSFEKRNALLRLTNEENNKATVSFIKDEYWRYMQKKSVLDIPLTEEEFEAEHENARTKALKEFDSKRNVPSTYTEDPYKSSLIKMIDDSFIQLKAMSKSKNKLLLQEAVFEYEKYMKSVLDTRSQCMHPSALERENQNGLCRALVKFRPNKQCSDGFDSNNKDENTLREILRQRYEDMANVNYTANDATVQKAYNVYVSTMDELCRPSLLWVLVIPYLLDMSKRVQNHETSKAKAYEIFTSRRKGGSYQYSTDPYKDHLDQMMEAYYGKTSSKYEEMSQKFISTAMKVGTLVTAAGAV